MKKINYKLVILFIISLAIIIFGFVNYSLYKTPILKVNTVVNSKLNESSKETHYSQKITGTIMNGKYKGKTLKATNRYSSSLVYDDKISKGDEIFVELSQDGSSILGITGIKRDKYLIVLAVIFVDLLILIGGKKGIKTLISLVFNVGISSLAIILYVNNYFKINLLAMYLVVSVIFIIVSLFITNGRSKKTLAAILSAICALILSFGLSFILIKLNEKRIYIWSLEYIEAIYDYSNYLYVSVLLCGLGAVMDISITISSALNELIEKNSKISKSALIKSGKIISKDIVGTMINVMLFTCYTSVIPTVILASKNSMPIIKALEFYGGLELTIVLCNCVGIVLTIPVSLFISIMILNKKKGSVE